MKTTSWIVVCIATMMMLTGCASADAGDAFPVDEAGISAYVNIGQNISLEDAVSAYYQIEELSATHALGKINIVNGGEGLDTIYVYVDVDGWIVAYLAKADYTARMIQWTDINLTNPVFERTTLSDAISKMCDSIGINYSNIESNIEYYDFEYPDADKMLIFTNIRTTTGDDYITALVPDIYTLYEASFSLTRHDGLTNLYIDGTKVASVRYDKYYNFRARTYGAYGTRFVVGDSHTIKFHGYPYAGWSGVANILIYS